MFFQELDSRIIIANFGSDVAPLVFCEVKNLSFIVVSLIATLKLIYQCQ